MSLIEFAKTRAFRLLRTGFRLMPIPPASRDRLRQRFLDRYASMLPSPPRGLPPHDQVRRPVTRATEPAVGYRSHLPGDLPDPLPAMLLAFYLPQFHSIPENDTWWGQGFTEWTNVTRALPQYEGHAQPRLPGELGFYDLRRPEVMRRQMALAREYGLTAFCTYFYWFAGKTLLETPLRQWLDNPSLDLPICLCWANENWSRRWDGRGEDVLIAQQHSPEDDIAFIAFVADYLRDPRYFRVDGKPLLLVYRPGLLPQPRETAERWRQWCLEHGLGEIHLAYVQSFDRVDPRHFGFDAAVEFPPNNTTLEPITSSQRLINPDFAGVVHDWRQLATNAMRAATPDYLVYPGVNPGWDNEPRRSGGGRVLAHASPRRYRDWLRHAIDVARRRSSSAPLVFINAWNEWAEGAVLEPDTRLGYAWLEATRSALRPPPANTKNARPCVVIHVEHVDALDPIVVRLHATGMDWRIIVTTAPQLESAVRRRLNELDLRAVLEIHDKLGLDVLPFLRVADRLLDEGDGIVLKLRAMAPMPAHDECGGQVELLDRLIGPERAIRILDAFDDDLHLGLVNAEWSARLPEHFAIAREARISALCVRLGLPVPMVEAHGDVVVGNMFWVRLAALRPVLDAHLEPWEIDAEIRRSDDTAAPVLGCMAELAVTAAGFHMRDAATASASQPCAAAVSTR